MIIVDIIKNKIIFESDNIYFVKINKDLIDDYLKMVNNPEVSKFISLKNRSFTYCLPVLKENAYIVDIPANTKSPVIHHA